MLAPNPTTPRDQSNKRAYFLLDDMLVEIEKCFDQIGNCIDPDRSRRLVEQFRAKVAKDLKNPLSVDHERALLDISIKIGKFRINSTPDDKWLSQITQARSDLEYRMAWLVKS